MKNASGVEVSLKDENTVQFQLPRFSALERSPCQTQLSLSPRFRTRLQNGRIAANAQSHAPAQHRHYIHLSLRQMVLGNVSCFHEHQGRTDLVNQFHIPLR